MDRNLLLAFALSFLVLSSGRCCSRRRPEAGTGAAGPGAAPNRRPAGSRARRAAAGGVPAAEPAEEAHRAFPCSRSRSRARSTSRSCRVRAHRCAIGSSRDTTTGTATRSDWSAAATARYCGHAVRELELGDLSKQVWRVESRSDTEVRFAWESRGVAIRRTSRSPTTVRFQATHRCVKSGPGPDCAEFAVSSRSSSDRVTTSASRARARSSPEARVHAAREPRQRGDVRVVHGEEGGRPRLCRRHRMGRCRDAVLPRRGLPRSAERCAHDLRELGARQARRRPGLLRSGVATGRPERGARYRGYFGPKEIERLEAFEPSAISSIDLGWSFVQPMTRAFGWLLAVCTRSCRTTAGRSSSSRSPCAWRWRR